jgi:ATP-dependent protease HslVU (ClpYQ) peptidase subunit
MTILVAYETEDEIIIGSDSLAIDGNTTTNLGSKLIDKGSYTIGFAGSYRAADLVREDKDLLIHEVTELKDLTDLARIRDAIKYILENDEGMSHESTFLLASAHGMFSIEEEYQIHKIEDYAALGGGEDFALGALATMWRAEKLYKDILNGNEVVATAIYAASKHCISCGGEIHTITHTKP